MISSPLPLDPARLYFISLMVGFTVIRRYHAWQTRRANDRHARSSAGFPPGSAPAPRPTTWVEAEGWAPILLRYLGFPLMLGITLAWCFGWPGLAGLQLPLPLWLRLSVGSLSLLGLGLLSWSQQTLGRFFSVNLELRASHALVQTGPYAWVRHPLYTALYLFFLPVGILSANLAIIGLNLAALALVTARIPREEAMLERAFGEAWREYRAQTGRLLPGRHGRKHS